jgi:hypothetical protein
MHHIGICLLPSWHVIGTECHLERLERAKQINMAANVTMLESKLDFVNVYLHK